MNRIDEELKLAASDSTSVLRDPPATVIEPASRHSSNRRASRPASKRSWGFLVGLALMGATILAVALTGLDNAAVYSKGVDQLLAERERFGSRNVRVVGNLVRGSLARRNEPCEYRFRLHKGAAELAVHYPQCIIPDTFRDAPNVDVEVTAEGRLQKDGTFLAHQIMAKCPSKYDMKQRTQSGESPHVARQDSEERYEASPVRAVTN
jgi:cytochrome c-type biogenesis protein CcmE